MDSPDSPGRGLIHSLNAVVSWLHSEGFYAAEETLLREIENRYPAPDAVSPRAQRQPSGSPGSSGDVGAASGDLPVAGISAACETAAAASAPGSVARPAGHQTSAFAADPQKPAQQPAPLQQQQQQAQQQAQHAGQEDTVDFMPALQLVAAHSLTPVDSMESAEKVLEAWRSKSTTPAASPKKAAGLSPPPSPPLPWSLGRPASELDEYENDDDPGYQRMDVVGQEAALGLELDQMSEGSTAVAGDALYHQLQQYESLGMDPGFSSHARHASIDMGLLNRQLHGGASRSSASSSQQRARSKQQQLPQGSGGAAAQPLLLHEAVTSGEHWRSGGSGQLLLPPGVPGPASVGREEEQQQVQHPEAQQQQQQQERQQQQEQQQRSGSPGGSEGGASYCSGEIVGSPGHPASGYKRSDSYAQRQAGTAQWVYDRANSVDADAYRSLLGHLERPSTGQSTPVSQPPASPPAPAGAPEAEAPQASASLDQPQGQGSSLTMRQLQQSEQAGQPARGEEAEVCSPLHHQESISRVSSLGESMLQEAAALCLSDAPEPPLGPAQHTQHAHHQQPGRPPRLPEHPQRPGEPQQPQQPQQQQQQWQGQPEQQALPEPPQQQGSPPAQPQSAGTQAAAATAAAWAAAGRAAQQQAQEAQQVQQQAQVLPLGEIEVEPAESAAPAALAEVTPPRLAKHLPALRLGGHQLGSGGGPGSGGKLGHRLSISTAADTTAANRGSEGECSSPHGSSAHTPDGASIIDYSDPFSFPVTPPSEVAPPPDPAPLFGSWASLKSSPDRKGGLGGYNTEDESTPARRRYQQQAAAAAVAAAAAAKEQGGVQRSIKFPPLGAPGGLAAAGSGMLRGYGSSSQLLGYATPSQPLTDDELGGGEYDQEYFDRKYEVINLKVIHRRNSTGFEQARELPLHIGDLIAGRYQIVDLLGQAAFSRAVQALDLKTGALVCLKIIKNNKDYFDQGLDEVKLLRYVNAADPGDESGLLRLHDFFYFKEHLVLVTELLRANLYEFQKYNRESGDEPYFTLPRIQSIARQVLTSLSFLHSLGLVHADLKPENILVKSYSRCQVKVIDLGSSCYLSDHLSSYVQSRSYRAPEVILGLSYDHKIDLWSLGCILAELATGRVLFQNDSVATLLARLEGILGPLPRWMLHRGRYAHKYFLRDGRVFEKNPHTARYEFLRPKATSLARRVPQADEGMLSFLKCLLQPDPSKRPTAAEALQHPWLRHGYYAAQNSLPLQ